MFGFYVFLADSYVSCSFLATNKKTTRVLGGLIVRIGFGLASRLWLVSF